MALTSLAGLGTQEEEGGGLSVAWGRQGRTTGSLLKLTGTFAAFSGKLWVTGMGCLCNKAFVIVGLTSAQSGVPVGSLKHSLEC